MSALKYWLWLAELRGLNNQTRLALLRHFGTPEDVFYADTGELLLTEGITREQALALENRDLRRRRDPGGLPEAEPAHFNHSGCGVSWALEKYL